MTYACGKRFLFIVDIMNGVRSLDIILFHAGAKMTTAIMKKMEDGKIGGSRSYRLICWRAQQRTALAHMFRQVLSKGTTLATQLHSTPRYIGLARERDGLALPNTHCVVQRAIHFHCAQVLHLLTSCYTVLPVNHSTAGMTVTWLYSPPAEHHCPLSSTHSPFS